MFDLSALERDLAGTLFAGKLHFALVTGSTNADAMAAARSGAPHGSVWLADEQTAGRGRGDHQWHSSAGQGLYVSVLLRLRVHAAHLALLPLAAGLAAAEAIRATAGLNVDLRWPNDLLIGSNKAGGILVESRMSLESPFHTFVVGVGINVHQTELPAGLATPATSLDLAAERRVSRQALLVSLLRLLEHEAWELRNPLAQESIGRRFEQASTWIRGRHVTVHGPQACEGVTAGLNELGFLLVRTTEGLVTVQTGGLRAVS